MRLHNGLRFGMLCVLCIVVAFISVPLRSAYSAEDAVITASVDRDHITLDEYVVLTLSVEGSREEPEVPDIPGFTVQSRGSSSQISIVNGAMTSKVQFTYVLNPQKTGVFTIGPFTIAQRGRTISSNTVTITVAQADQQPRQSSDIFVTAQVDNDHPYVHQQIVCTFQFWRAVQVANANLVEIPSFEGFLAEDLGKPVEFQKILNGRRFTVTEMKKALFPVSTGMLEIAPFTLQCDVVVQKSRRRGFFQDPFFNDPFFGFTETAPKTLKTSPVQVAVRQLPVEGKPSDFKNLVGIFSLNASLSKASVAAGESTTLTLTLTGTGNMKNLTGIELQPVENLKVYDDKPTYHQKTEQGKIGGTLTLKKALVPLAPGTIAVPPVVVHYFDPDDGVYKRAATAPLSLAVAPADQPTVVAALPQNNPVKQDITVLGRDIMPIHTTPDALYHTSLRLHPWLAAALFLLPIALFITSIVVRSARNKSPHDMNVARSRKAFSVFKKELRAIKPLLHQDSAVFYQRASKAFKDFAGDKLGISGAAMTTRDLYDALRSAGIDDAAASDASRLLEFFDTGIFGSVRHNPSEKQRAYDALLRIARSLDRRVKYPRQQEAAA